MYLSLISVRRVCRWFWRTTQGNSQTTHETLWLVHHEPLKKWDLNEARHGHRGYTRGSKVRRVFPSTFSLLPCLGFSQWECTAGITLLLLKINNYTNFITQDSQESWKPVVVSNTAYTLKRHTRTLCSQTCSEDLFFHKFSVSHGKITNQLRWQLHENYWQGRKIVPRTWKRTKIQTNTVPTEPQKSFSFIEKLTGECSQWTACKQFMNPVLITRTSCSQVHAQLYVYRFATDILNDVHTEYY